MDEYKRWKFWERWGWRQLFLGVLMFVIPMFFSTNSNLHYYLAGSMGIGILLALSALFIAMEFSGRVSGYEWRQKYDRCPTCHQGWIRKEK